MTKKPERKTRVKIIYINGDEEVRVDMFDPHKEKEKFRSALDKLTTLSDFVLVPLKAYIKNFGLY